MWRSEHLKPTITRLQLRTQHKYESNMISYISPGQRVPQDHSLRSLRAMADEALQDLQPRFNKLYAKLGAPRLRQKSCCERSCSKRCIRCAATDSGSRKGGGTAEELSGIEVDYTSSALVSRSAFLVKTSACENILRALRALRSARPRMIRALVLAQPWQ